jgi:serine/threonine protein kinase
MLTNDQVLGKGRYRIINNFTHDECGGLYEAYDTVSNTKVVLRETVAGSGKVMTATQLDAINNAFVGEAKALAEVRHESLLGVQDYFSEIDRHYLVMESVDGSDFTRFLKIDEEPPALMDVLAWTEQLLEALIHLHNQRKRIIHRDIRPANVRLTSNFKVKLLTAGLSADGADVIMAQAANPSDTSILNYRPLEQLWGGLDPASQKVIANSYDDSARRDLYKPLDARSDIYSLGATLYHLISRTLPSDALERSIEILDGNNDPLLPLIEVDASVPADVSEFVMKALELKRHDRYDSAASMREALADVRDGMKERKATPSSQPRIAPEPLSKPTPDPVPVSAPDPEEEKAKVEARRQELAAQKQRLEAEQKAIEDERRALESEQERQRAEQRKREMEADLLRQQKEAERIRSAQKKEAEAQKPVVDAGSDEQFLLEVEPVKAAESTAAAENVFEWSEEDLNISRTPESSSSSSRSIFESTDYAEEPKSNMKFVAAGGGALVVVLAIVGWMFVGGSSKPQTAQSQPTQTQQSVQQDQTPVSGYNDQQQTSPDSTSTSASTEPAATLNDAVPAQTDTSAAQAKKKATPTPAKTPPKKKVTVDDLINDN